MRAHGVHAGRPSPRARGRMLAILRVRDMRTLAGFPADGSEGPTYTRKLVGVSRRSLPANAMRSAYRRGPAVGVRLSRQSLQANAKCSGLQSFAWALASTGALAGKSRVSPRNASSVCRRTCRRTVNGLAKLVSVRPRLAGVLGGRPRMRSQGRRGTRIYVPAGLAYRRTPTCADGVASVRQR